MGKVKEKDYKVISLDWKQIDETAIEKIKETLETFGIYVYSIDDWSDTYELLFSSKKLTASQIKQIQKNL